MIRPKSHKRFALLCRVSTRSQQREGISLDVQRERGCSYVQRHHGHVVQTYSGQESATKPAEERALLQRMLADAKAGKFDAIWCLDTSRLSRSAATAETTMALLAGLNVELHTDSGPVDFESPEREFGVILEAAAGRLMARSARKRTRESRETLLEDGEQACGKSPWGRHWDKVAKDWRVDPEARRKAHQMYRAYVVEGLGLSTAAAKVGMPHSTFRKRLRMAGIGKWQRTLQTPEGERTFTLNVPPLLSAAQAAAIARRLESNLTVQPHHRKRSLLQGLVRCAHCGGTMSHVTAGPNGKYAAYRHLPSTRKRECIFQVPAPMLEEAVLTAVGEMLTSRDKLIAAVRKAVENAKTDAPDIPAELADVEREIKREERAHNAAIESLIYFANGSAEREKTAERAKVIGVHLQSLRARQEHLATAAGKTVERSAAEIDRQLRAVFGRHGLAVMRLSKDKQRELVSLVIGREHKEDAHGIYVRMHRGHVGRRDLAWEWSLRGSLGLLQGTGSHLEFLQERGRARLHLMPDTARLERFVRLVEGLGKPGVSKVSLSYSSGASPRCG